MIGRLSGRIARKAPQALLLDVRGVGYQITIPLSTFYTLAGEGEEAVLEISTQVREDAITLFGFATARERVLFEQLISVSKVGPKLATSVLSGIAADELCAAISSGNVARLATVPGIGLKTAERLVLELRGKVQALASDAVPAARGAGDSAGLASDDAVAALVNLGYKARDAEKAVGRAAREGDGSLEAIIRRALTILSG
ncbi:MAG: Holliday junction branch migration protein RuvA [Candidatus Methylomirabilia bacterium]